MPRDWYIALNLEASCMRESGSWRRRYIRHLFIYNVYSLTLCYVKRVVFSHPLQRAKALVGWFNQSTRFKCSLSLLFPPKVE
jgi:hypothetical protein